MAKPCSYWLMKTEPDCFSIQDLAASPRQTTCWNGVRNYQARNFMRAMKAGDQVLFYHSSADPPVVAGTAVVVGTAYPDHTAWDPHDPHFDAKASPDHPIWEMVDIRLEWIFSEPVPIAALRKTAALRGMELLRQGSRLSVQPVMPSHFEIVVALAGRAQTSPAARPKAAPRKKRAAAK